MPGGADGGSHATPVVNAEVSLLARKRVPESRFRPRPFPSWGLAASIDEPPPARPGRVRQVATLARVPALRARRPMPRSGEALPPSDDCGHAPANVSQRLSPVGRWRRRLGCVPRRSLPSSRGSLLLYARGGRQPSELRLSPRRGCVPPPPPSLERTMSGEAGRDSDSLPRNPAVLSYPITPQRWRTAESYWLFPTTRRSSISLFPRVSPFVVALGEGRRRRRTTPRLRGPRATQDFRN